MTVLQARVSRITITLVAAGLLGWATPVFAGEEAAVPWDTECSQVARGEEPDCQMSQIVFLPETGQLLLRVTIRVQSTDRTPAMMLQLPHGMFIPEGVTLTIDEQPWQTVQVQTSDQAGGYAGIDMDAAAVERLSSAQVMSVTFLTLDRRQVTVPVNLTGFAETYARIR
jgi:invasion protein IalB